MEIPVLLLRRQKLILRIPIKRPTHDDAVRDPPDLRRFPFPPVESLAIKKRHGSCRGGGNEQQGIENELRHVEWH